MRRHMSPLGSSPHRTSARSFQATNTSGEVNTGRQVALSSGLTSARPNLLLDKSSNSAIWSMLAGLMRSGCA